MTPNFDNFLTLMKSAFSPYKFINLDAVMDDILILSTSNLKCYEANMQVIQLRNEGSTDYKAMADCELVARTVGEKRVSKKAKINSDISASLKGATPPDSVLWITDDVVYSIGEMLDRLSIEEIKQWDFNAQDPVPLKKLTNSKILSDRVFGYLKAKLIEIEHKNFYEAVEETRTYEVK